MDRHAPGCLVATAMVIAAVLGCGAPKRVPPQPQSETAPAPERVMDDPVSRHVQQLRDPAQRDQALRALEALEDPRAIPLLIEEWRARRHPKVLAALAHLAELAQSPQLGVVTPTLLEALVGVDETRIETTRSAAFAAMYFASHRAAEAAPALAVLARRPIAHATISAQEAALAALASFPSARALAISVCGEIIVRPIPDLPDRRDSPAHDEVLAANRLAMSALSTLAGFGGDEVVSPLVLGLYANPGMDALVLDALVTGGPRSREELRKVLRGEHAAVNELIRSRGLAQHCSAGGGACTPIAIKDYLAARALAKLHDVQAVPDLLAALKRPPAPSYFFNDRPAPSQHLAIIEALGELGSVEAAAPLRALWLDPKQSDELRSAALEAYSAAVPSGASVHELLALSRDPRTKLIVRWAAGRALGRIARDARAIAVVRELGQLERATGLDLQRKAEALRPDPAAQELDRVVQETLSSSSNTFALVAGIRVAMQCQNDARCLIRSMRRPLDEVVRDAAAHSPDASTWSEMERLDLQTAALTRASLDLRKLGVQPDDIVAELLAALRSDEPAVAYAISTLPRIARLPCRDCVTALADVAAARGGALASRAAVARNYFTAFGAPAELEIRLPAK